MPNSSVRPTVRGVRKAPNPITWSRGRSWTSAYYPYAENADPTALVYDASVAEADFMTARTPGFSERDGEIRLVFRHKLALAEAFVADADKLTDYAVTVQDVRTKAVFSLAAAAQDA